MPDQDPGRAHGAPAGAPSRPSRVASLTLLAAEGAGAVMLGRELFGATWLGRFIAHNELDPVLRSSLILSLVCGGAAALACGLWYARRRAGRGWARVARAARLASPLCVLWALPPLLDAAAYPLHDLEFLITASLLVIATERCFRASFSAWPKRAPAGRLARARRRHAPLAAITLLASSYAFVASVGSIRLHRKLLTSIYDLGLFENLLFNTVHGMHGIALGFHYFAVHAELILYGILPVFWLAPRPETLLILQSVFLAGAMVPLYLIACRWLRNGWQAAALVATYALFPAVHGPNFYDFHFLTLSVFFVAWTAYFFVTRGRVLFWIAALLAMCCREDVALGLCVVGFGLAWMGWQRRVSLALALVGAAWFLTTKFFWMPQFGGPTFTEYYAGLVAPGEAGFGSVLRTLLSNPLFVLSTMLSREKLIIALQLLMPLAFLPIRQWRTLPLLLPGGLVLGLSTGSPAILQLSFQYVCHFTPYLFIACAAALAVRPSTQRWAAIAAIVLGSVVASARFGALRGDQIASGFQNVSFAWLPSDAARLADLRALAQRIPAQASVCAGEHEGPHVANRPLMFTAKDGVLNADYVLFGLHSLHWGGRDAILRALHVGSYGVVEHRGQLALLARGAPTTGNAALIGWLLRTPIP